MRTHRVARGHTVVRRNEYSRMRTHTVVCGHIYRSICGTCRERGKKERGKKRARGKEREPGRGSNGRKNKIKK